MPTPLHPIAERFIRYAQIDTQSDPDSNTFPSTAKQKNLSALLAKELQEMGVKDAHMDEWGYVYATLPATSSKKVPVICLCSHVDTAPDCNGTDVKPIVHPKYDGRPIVLPDDSTQVISTEQHPYLLEKVGDDIITASGCTLLGADDKAGVAIIMELAKTIMLNPQIPHGEIKILFTPDEEVGRGVEHVDMKKLGADFGYTLDGGELGVVEYETFSADGMEVVFYGVMAHPGSAKGIMVNALKLASDFISALPKDRLAPEVTSGREGFVHPTDVRGNAEIATVKLLIRDFDTSNLAVHEQQLESIAAQVIRSQPTARYSIKITEQYRNMREILDQQPEVYQKAIRAVEHLGLAPRVNPVRGGTDGSRLSCMGLPCPNLFTGEMALHSKHEFVSIQDMEKSHQVLMELLRIWEADSPA
jgi:tripeptide aminopeptidase